LRDIKDDVERIQRDRPAISGLSELGGIARLRGQ